jgi:predicted RND superfamily exporter protein
MLNFLSILLIIGIGIDDGVHILHHYKTGVKKINYLFSSVGKAILMTTLTTVLGFGSLMFSSYRGIASLGAALSIGVLYAFIMTVIVLPILIKE